MKQKIFDLYANHKKLIFIILIATALILIFSTQINNLFLKKILFKNSNVGSGDSVSSGSSHDIGDIFGGVDGTDGSGGGGAGGGAGSGDPCSNIEEVKDKIISFYSIFFSSIHKVPNTNPVINPSLGGTNVDNSNLEAIELAEAFIREKLKDASDSQIREFCQNAGQNLDKLIPSDDDKEIVYSELLKLDLIDPKIVCVLTQENKFTLPGKIYSNFSFISYDINYDFFYGTTDLPKEMQANSHYQPVLIKANLYECFADNDAGSGEPVERDVLGYFIFVQPFFTVKNEWTAENNILITDEKFAAELDNLQNPVGQFKRYDSYTYFKQNVEGIQFLEPLNYEPVSRQSF